MLAVSERKLIEAELSDNIAHSSLADLIDRIVDVLNYDHCFFRVGNMIVKARSPCDSARPQNSVRPPTIGVCIKLNTRTDFFCL